MEKWSLESSIGTNMEWEKSSSNVNDFTHTWIHIHMHTQTYTHSHTHIQTQCIYLNNLSFLEFLVCQLNTPQLKVRTQGKSLSICIPSWMSAFQRPLHASGLDMQGDLRSGVQPTVPYHEIKYNMRRKRQITKVRGVSISLLTLSVFLKVIYTPNNFWVFLSFPK